MHGNGRAIRQGKLFGNIHDGKRSHMFRRSLVSTAHPDGRITTAPLAENFNPRQVFRRPPQWNQCLVRVVGNHVQLYLNGVLANEIFDRAPAMRSTGDGIALQFRPRNAYRFEVRQLRHRPITESTSTSSQQPSTQDIAALASQGNYAQAAAILEARFADDPATLDSSAGLNLAILYAALGEKEKHHAWCQQLSEKFSDWETPTDAERPAKAYLVYPGADDPALLREAFAGSRHALRVGQGRVRIWFELTRGMSHYRLGEYQQATESLTRPLNRGQPIQKALAGAFAAMAAYKQNRIPQARRLLAAAQSEFNTAEFPEQAWGNIIVCKIAIDEADALIR